MNCDFCGSKDLEYIYRPIRTIRDSSVHICNNCGLVQTIYGPHTRDRSPRISGDADWGNVRWCKSFRLDDISSKIKKFLENKPSPNVLDIGCSRGDFLRWIESEYPEANVMGVEPDERLASSYDSKLMKKIVFQRFEFVDFRLKKFDFIYCVQTLEHAASAKEMLTKITDLLSDDGVAFIEVPNLNVLSHENSIEEFFIDKHSYHFTESNLLPFLEEIGLNVIDSHAAYDRNNVAVYVKKDLSAKSNVWQYKISKKDTVNIRNLIKNYEKIVKKNRSKLCDVVSKINQLNGRMRVAFWGATTIFDLLVKYGKLEPSKVNLLVDTYLHRFADTVHGVKIESPDCIQKYEPDVCIVLARFSAIKIAKEAKSYGVRNVITFDQLISSTK